MAKRMPAFEILPPDGAEPPPTAASCVANLPEDLRFTPVPRRAARSNGLTPDRQRVFIALLAGCGSVLTACKAIGCSSPAMYHLRNSAGAESFAAAWDNAVQRGARRILDVMVDHAINGVPEYIYKDGQVVAERRHFNTRAQMWIVAHYMPEKFGVTGGLMHGASGPIGLKRLKAAWQREWEAEAYAAQKARESGGLESYNKKVNAIRRHFKRGIAADPAKRAAWDLLAGPTDWTDFDNLPDYGWNPDMGDTNQNRPDMVLTMTKGLDGDQGKGA